MNCLAWEKLRVASYRQHSSQDHMTTQAPPLRQIRDAFGLQFHATEFLYRHELFEYYVYVYKYTLYIFTFFFRRNVITSQKSSKFDVFLYNGNWWHFGRHISRTEEDTRYEFKTNDNRKWDISLPRLIMGPLGALVKKRKVINSFAMSVYSSVRSHGTTRPPLDRYSWNLKFGYFSKICWAIWSSSTSGKNNE